MQWQVYSLLFVSALDLEGGMLFVKAVFAEGGRMKVTPGKYWRLFCQLVQPLQAYAVDIRIIVTT